ncbi:hypothetical protein PR048_019217, partial [Dryococelus australis]
MENMWPSSHHLVLDRILTTIKVLQTLITNSYIFLSEQMAEFPMGVFCHTVIFLRETVKLTRTFIGGSYMLLYFLIGDCFPSPRGCYETIFIKQLTQEKSVCNYWFSHGQRIENIFGIMTARIKAVVFAYCALHNFLHMIISTYTPHECFDTKSDKTGHPSITRPTCQAS